MRSDWDDAPNRLKYRKNEGLRLGVALFVGCTVTATALFFGAKFLKRDSPPAPESSAQYIPRYDFSETPESSASSAEEQFWSDVNKRNQEENQRQKQTVFNDNNYTPKGAVNVVSMEGVRESAAYQGSGEQEREVSENTVEHESQFIRGWSGDEGYTANWTAINNRIDSRSVCANYRRGSIDYRECRKAAKQHFHEQCREWRDQADNDREAWSIRMQRRYCSAASGFSPMG